MSCVSVDNLTEVAVKLGREIQLAKTDIKSAYRVVPVYPEDRLLLGIAWREQVYVDLVHPFGHHSAPKIFKAVADALQWVMLSRKIRFILHYLNDFAMVGAPHSHKRQLAYKTMLAMCEQLGFPVVPAKCEGPTTCLSFLSIEVDMASMQLWLPVED